MSKLALTFPGTESLTEDLSDVLDPRESGGPLSLADKTPAEIVNDILPYALIFAGIILFAMLIAGGFSIFVSAGNPEKIKKGQAMLVNALIGFLIIFSAYWIIQILEFSLGIQVL
jgi:hypothetical protein